MNFMKRLLQIIFHLVLTITKEIIFYNHIYVIHFTQLAISFSWFVELILKISIFNRLLTIRPFVGRWHDNLK